MTGYKNYEKILGQSHKYYIKTKCDTLLDVLDTLKFEPKEALDLGCGTGEAEELLNNSFDNITGVDISNEMLSVARKKKIKNCKFVFGDALKLRFKDCCFDLVFSFCLFHHVEPEKRLSLLSEMKRVTKRGGVILTFEQNPINPITRYIVWKCPIDKGVELIYSSQMENLYQKVGLTIVKKRFLIYFPYILSFLKQLEKLLGYLPFGGQYLIAGKR